MAVAREDAFGGVRERFGCVGVCRSSVDVVVVGGVVEIPKLQVQGRF